MALWPVIRIWSDMQTPTSHPMEPHRKLGPLASAALLAGTVIGTGIFLVPAIMARETGSVWLVFAVWIFGALLSLAGALTYAELGSSLPAAGGEYIFLRRAYGPLWGFLFGWQQITIGKTGSIAGIAVAFSVFLGYFTSGLEADIADFKTPFGIWSINGLQACAITAILFLSLINCAGVALGCAVQSLLTLIKILAILALAALVFGSERGDWNHFNQPLPTLDSMGGLDWIGHMGAALAAALWAFDGWNNLTMVGAEIRNPHKTIPKVLVIGVLSVAGVYLVANLTYFYALPFDAVRDSERVAQDVATTIMGARGGDALTIAALISTTAALNGSILSGARVFFAMSGDGLLLRSLSRLHPVHHTPVRALTLQALLASLLILVFGHDREALERILDFALFGMWGFYGITAVSVIVLRRRHPELPRPYLTLGYPWIPLLFSSVALMFCVSIALRRPWETAFGLGLLATGLPVYLWMRWRQQG